MNTRVVRTELMRSVAPWAGAVTAMGGLAFLYALDGPWWKGTEQWTAQWTSMAMWTRSMLAFLWPLAVGLGALQGLRDRRSKVPELLTSTPRPAWQRAAVLSGTTAVTLAAGFGVLLLAGAVQVAGGAEYTHLGWLPISLVAVVSLVAGAALGMGVGRALPSALTPPVLAVAALFVTALLRMTPDGAEPSSALPVPLVLLSPSVEGAEVLRTLAASVHIGQTVWLLGMAATGFALLVAATPRARLLALTPILSGAAVALLVLPAAPGQTYVLDEDAAAKVCEGRVCVTRAHQGELALLAGPGRKALRLLRESLGGEAPTAIRETTVQRSPMETMERSRTHVIVDFDDPVLTEAKGGEELTRVLVGLGAAPNCFGRSWAESTTSTELASQTVAASWALGELKPIGTVWDPVGQMKEARPAWKELKALPRAEQRSRIKAMHDSALSCDSDPLEALTGGGSQ